MHVYPRKYFFRHFMVALKKNFSNIFFEIGQPEDFKSAKKEIGFWGLHFAQKTDPQRV